MPLHLSLAIVVPGLAHPPVAYTKRAIWQTGQSAGMCVDP